MTQTPISNRKGMQITQIHFSRSAAWVSFYKWTRIDTHKFKNRETASIEGKNVSCHGGGIIHWEMETLATKALAQVEMLNICAPLIILDLRIPHCCHKERIPKAMVSHTFLLVTELSNWSRHQGIIKFILCPPDMTTLCWNSSYWNKTLICSDREGFKFQPG